MTTLSNLGDMQKLTGDYPAAADTNQQAQALARDLGDRYWQAWVLNQLGVLHGLVGDYPAAAASHQQALRLMREGGEPSGQACVLNGLGELASHTLATGPGARPPQPGASHRPPDRRPLEEARALEGIGHSQLQDGNPAEAAAHLGQALTIYQRLGTPPRPARRGNPAPTLAPAQPRAAGLADRWP
jgi:tetratricopeptide (TPR) repeat protein